MSILTKKQIGTRNNKKKGKLIVCKVCQNNKPHQRHKIPIGDLLMSGYFVIFFNYYSLAINLQFHRLILSFIESL